MMKLLVVADHVVPPLEEVSVENVGVGDTLVVGMRGVYFHPSVPPELPLTTMKYCVEGASATGVDSGKETSWSSSNVVVSFDTNVASTDPGLPLTALYRETE
jgi:hypothetical protein